jgi:hypothetical protein
MGYDFRFECTLNTVFDGFEGMEEPPDISELNPKHREWVVDEFIRTVTPTEVQDLLQDDDWDDYQIKLHAYLATGEIVLMEAMRLKFRDKPGVIDAINEGIERAWRIANDQRT